MKLVEFQHGFEDVENIEESDYPTLVKWAKELKQVPPPFFILPLGLVALDELNQKQAMGFIYYSKFTPVSVLEWIFVNPVLKPKKKMEAINAVIDGLIMLSESEGYSFMMAGSSCSGMTKQFLKKNFMVANTGFTHLVRLQEG